MKKLFILALMFVGSMATKANTTSEKPDSVIVNFGDKTRIVIYGDKKEDIKKLLKYDVNKVLRDLSIKLDTTQSNRITINGYEPQKNTEQIANVKLGDADYKVIVENGKLILEKRHKDSAGESITRTEIGNATIEKDTTKNGKNGNNSHVNISFGKNKKGKEWYADKKENFVLSLGLNAYGVDYTPSSAYKTDEYDLRPLGSRFVSLGFYRKATIAKGESVALRIKSGFEFSWYNLMFEGNNVVQNVTPVTFPNAKETLSKTKLTVCYINVPLMLMTSFKNSAITHIGAGGYAGYRLDSHTKTKTENGGNKDHVNGRFGLNQFRYGLMAEIGFRKSVDIFGQYDMNKLFETAKGPNVQMISFGVRFH